ncbi:unnamed protein product [Phytophthora fragariaefolia]|uniref:Unnamed protein product n=1 Tax=Phytophthora fragariaefolia TaxID=1490495 RepID=A0A9W6XRM0_9STRA|nr:unnamed protein product [Phytophthora fragariaefolia]
MFSLEWDLTVTHDIILGKPWFSRFNPVIARRTHEVTLDLGLLDPFWFIEEDERLFQLVEEIEAAGRTGHGSCWYAGRRVGPGYEASASPIARLLQDYTDCFPDELPNELPVSRVVEFGLTKKPDARPSPRAPFRLSKTEQEALKLFGEDLLEKMWIETSGAPWVSSIFAVPKNDPVTGKAPSKAEWIRSGTASLPVRWVMDYRYVNSQTEVPKIPLPRIDELFDQMVGCRLFSTLELVQRYHQMRVEPASRKYTASRTESETYQWCVAPMGMSGIPGVWSRLMRMLFWSLQFCGSLFGRPVYFSRTEAEHIAHLTAVFEVLRAQKLYGRLAKCKFGCESVDFLSHTVSAAGLQVDQRKTRTIEDWPTPMSVRDLQSSLGLCGYYRRFIGHYASIVLPLSELLKNDVLWTWTDTQHKARMHLKAALQQAPVLKLPDYTKRFLVTTDASGFCCGAVLSQKHAGEDHPVAFISKKFSRHEINWPTHEKELFAIELALRKWRHYLHGRVFDVFTDNSACKWFLSHPNVSGKLARCLAFFGQFSLVLHHVKGSTNAVADALSRVAKPAFEDTPVETSSISVLPPSQTSEIKLLAAQKHVWRGASDWGPTGHDKAQGIAANNRDSPSRRSYQAAISSWLSTQPSLPSTDQALGSQNANHRQPGYAAERKRHVIPSGGWKTRSTSLCTSQPDPEDDPYSGSS